MEILSLAGHRVWRYQSWVGWAKLNLCVMPPQIICPVFQCLEPQCYGPEVQSLGVFRREELCEEGSEKLRVKLS